MTRRKGEDTTRGANERNFPHIVEIAVSPNGFDVALRRAMEFFHQSHNIRPQFGRSVKRNARQYCRWCFADAKVADAFCEQFGGVTLLPPLRPRRFQSVD